MAQNSYALFKQSEVFYWFISTGPNGDIPKGVFLTPADVPAVSNPFNLGLADYVNDEWTDENITRCLKNSFQANLLMQLFFRQSLRLPMKLGIQLKGLKNVKSK